MDRLDPLIAGLVDAGVEFVIVHRQTHDNLVRLKRFLDTHHAIVRDHHG